MEIVDIKMNQQLLAGSPDLGTDPDPVDPGSSDAPDFLPDLGPSVPSFPWDM